MDETLPAITQQGYNRRTQQQDIKVVDTPLQSYIDIDEGSEAVSKPHNNAGEPNSNKHRRFWSYRINYFANCPGACNQ